MGGGGIGEWNICARSAGFRETGPLLIIDRWQAITVSQRCQPIRNLLRGACVCLSLAAAAILRASRNRHAVNILGAYRTLARALPGIGFPVACCDAHS